MGAGGLVVDALLQQLQVRKHLVVLRFIRGQVRQEVALDLGENEIALDLGDSSPVPSAPPIAAPLDEIELNLEIDDSDGPLTIQTQDIPDIEIEDLGLELESSDDPEPDKP